MESLLLGRNVTAATNTKKSVTLLNFINIELNLEDEIISHQTCLLQVLTDHARFCLRVCNYLWRQQDSRWLKNKMVAILYFILFFLQILIREVEAESHPQHVRL